MKTSKESLVQSLSEIEKIIKYSFNDKQLLINAFTHSSYSHIHGDRSNERMEFLGDALLDFVVAQYLYENYPNKNEGDYTQVRADVVDTASLHREILQMNLINFLLVGNKSLEDDIAVGKNKKLFADLYEAVLCAIYLDGGLNEAKRFIFDTLAKELGESMYFETSRDFKTLLKEASEKRHFSIEYVLDKRQGSDNSPTFYFSVFVNGQKKGEGYGSNSKEAQNYAAKRALKNLNLF